MKRILTIILIFIGLGASAQTVFLIPNKIIRQYFQGSVDTTRFEGDSLKHITNKSFYVFNKTIKAPSIQIGSGTISPPEFYEHEISTDGENNIAVTVPLTSTTKIYYNGTIIGQSRWQGVGGTTLNLILDTKKNDKLIITN